MPAPIAMTSRAASAVRVDQAPTIATRCPARLEVGAARSLSDGSTAANNSSSRARPATASGHGPRVAGDNAIVRTPSTGAGRSRASLVVPRHQRQLRPSDASATRTVQHGGAALLPLPRPPRPPCSAPERATDGVLVPSTSPAPRGRAAPEMGPREAYGRAHERPGKRVLASASTAAARGSTDSSVTPDLCAPGSVPVLSTEPCRRCESAPAPAGPSRVCQARADTAVTRDHHGIARPRACVGDDQTVTVRRPLRSSSPPPPSDERDAAAEVASEQPLRERWRAPRPGAGTHAPARRGAGCGSACRRRQPPRYQIAERCHRPHDRSPVVGRRRDSPVIIELVALPRPSTTRGLRAGTRTPARTSTLADPQAVTGQASPVRYTLVS